ncbi:MAG: dipeptidase [Armatimonadota bacterium]
MMLIIDGHEDLAWNAVEMDRDLTAPLAAIRAREASPPAPHGEGTATVSLPSLRAAGVRVVMGTIFTYPAGSTSSGRPGYATPDEAFERGYAQIAYYQQLTARGEATILHRRPDLENAMHQRVPLPGLIPLMEGADPIRTPDELARFVDWGVRIVGLSWKATRYAGGTGAPGPLTDAGRALLHEMERLGVALDVSHLAEEAFWQALEIFHGRVIASHANCRAIVPGDRQLSDDMIRAIADRDGVIGLVLYNRFIRPGWASKDGKDAVHLADLLPHVEHLHQVAGARSIGLGTDLDGGVGREDTPAEIDSIADLPRFADTLAAAGYDQPTITGIMGENWLRILREILPI